MINEILEKYSESMLNNLDKDNFHEILKFLIKEKCECIEDIIEDYLDVFTIDYDKFIVRYNNLNKKYNGYYLKLVSENMNLLEEMFYD